jgi:effector-binding domain-containing protein
MNTPVLENMEVEVDRVLAAKIDATCPADPAAIGEAMNRAFAALGSYVEAQGLRPKGPPRAVYTAFSPSEIRFTAALPVATLPPSTAKHGDVRVGMMPGGRALRFLHRGPYATLRETYARIEEWLRERGAFDGPADWGRYSPMWEEYVTEPGTVPDVELVTHIYLPLPVAGVATRHA